MQLWINVCFLILLSGASPGSGAACTTKVTFPIKASGLTTLPWRMDVFGIPIFATNKWKSSTNIAKMYHVASIMAELIDNDNDGCADDPAALKKLLAKSTAANMPWKGYQICLVLTEIQTNEMDIELKAKGYFGKKSMTLMDCEPKGSGLNYGKDGLEDASIEEIYHLMNSDGHVLAHPKELGIGWTSQSPLTKAMDLARGKRIQITPAKQSLYPATAWYRYADTSCDYQCQAIEYLWWGYCAYSGIGNGIDNPESFAEFKYPKKADFVKKDLGLAKFYQNSELKKSSYRLPTKPVDGNYYGCATCATGTNYG